MKFRELTTRLTNARELLSLTPFEMGSAEGRSRERHRRMLLTTLASAAAKAVSIATALISVPLTLKYLGAERYGMWLMISSLITILSFADLGMGNGLLNRISAANGADDRKAIRGYISSGFGVLGAIAASLLTLFWVLYGLTPWEKLFNVTSTVAIAEAGPAVGVFATCFALSIPAAIVQKVQAGLQQGFTSNLWQCAGSLTSLIGIILATSLHLGLPWLVLSFVGAPLAINAINAITFFRSNSDIAPKRVDFSKQSAMSIARTGWLFLILQITGAISYSSDALIIAHVLGPKSVPQYSVPERMFSLVGMVIAMGLAPLWPAYGEAISRADHSWVRATFLRSIGLAVALAAAGSFTLFFAGPTLLHLWVGNEVKAPILLLAGLAIWKILEAAGNAIAMFLNGAHAVKFQVVAIAITGIVIITLKFLLLNLIGISGTIWATIIGFSLFTMLPLGLKARSIINGTTNMKASENANHAPSN